MADGFFETGGEGTARHGNLGDDFADGQGSIGGMLADVTQGGGDECVVEGEVVGGFAADELAAADAGDPRGLVSGVGDHSVEDGCRLITKALVVDLNAGEWWQGGFTDDFFVPHAHDGEVVWTAQAHLRRGLGDERGGDVGIGEDACRQLELLELLLDKLNGTAPILAVAHHDVGHVLFRPLEELAGFPSSFEQLAKGVGTAMGGFEASRAKVGKTIKSQADQVFGGELGDLGVVPEYEGCPGVFVEPAGGVDHGDGRFFQPCGIEDAVFPRERNDAVTVPGGIEGDRTRPEMEVAVHFELPATYAAGKIDDTLEDPGGITWPGLQGNADAQGAGGIGGGQNATKLGLNCYCGNVVCWGGSASPKQIPLFLNE